MEGSESKFRMLQEENRRLEEENRRLQEEHRREAERHRRLEEENRRLEEEIRMETEKPPLQRVFTEQEIESFPKELPSHEFKLIGSCKTEYPSSAVTLSCNLSPELSAVDLEIRWFKETECVYLYKNRQVTEGKGYEDRVSLFRDELEKGNVSLQLKNCSWLDLGDYLCQVTDGDTTEELTVRMMADPLEFDRSPPQRVVTEQTDRKWINEERLKMEKSSLLIEHNSLLSEFKKKSCNLEKTQDELKNTKLELEQVMETNQKKLEEMQDKMQEMMTLLEQQKTELSEKNKELEEKDRLLSERERQQMDKDKQLQEKDDFKEEQLQECTDPDPSVPIRRRKSIETPPSMSGESSGDLEGEKLQQRLSELAQDSQCP